MQNRISLFLVSIFLVFGACQEPLIQVDEDSSGEEIVTGYNSIIEVRVAVCHLAEDPQCFEAYGAPGASVRLFLTEEDREFGEPVYRSGVTGGVAGVIEFSGVEAGQRFYMETVYSGEKVESTETSPVNGIAKHEVLFFE